MTKIIETPELLTSWGIHHKFLAIFCKKKSKRAMSDFSVDFTKSYARRRPEELGSPVGAQWEWEPRGLVVFGPVLMAISMGKCCWTMKFSCVFLENNRIDHEILEPVLKTKPNDEVGDENAGVYQRTLVGCNHPKHGYNQQVYLIKMIS